MNLYELYGNENAYELNSYRDVEIPSYYGELDYTNHLPEDPKEVWYIPKYTSGGDYCGGCIYARSNLEVILELAEENGIENISEISGGYGGFGLAIRGDVSDEELIEALKSLEDYPILDDDHSSNMEFEAENEAWENWVKDDFIRELEKKFDCELEIDDNKIFELFNDTEPEWMNEGGLSMYVSVDYAVKKIEWEDVKEFAQLEDDDPRKPALISSEGLLGVTALSLWLYSLYKTFAGRE